MRKGFAYTAKLALGVVVGIVGFGLWVAGPTIHTIEIGNQTGSAMSDLTIVVGDRAVPVEPIPAGHTQRVTLWARTSNEEMIELRQAGRPAGRCGYLTHVSTKWSVEVRSLPVRDKDCRWIASYFFGPVQWFR